MRLWSSELLEVELARGQVSEREKVKYLLLPMLLTALAGGPAYLITPNYGTRQPPLALLTSAIGGILVAIVTFYGIRHVYRTNKKIDGLHFVERYIVLSLPVHVRFAALMLPLTLVLGFVFYAVKRNHHGVADHFATWFGLLFPLLLVWLYRMIAASFERFGWQLRRASSASSSPPAAT